MFRLRHIANILIVVLFLAANSGIPVSIHMCGGEPVASACPPDECCADDCATEDTEEESCCTELVSVASMNERSITAPSVIVPGLVAVLDQLAAYRQPFFQNVPRNRKLSSAAEHPYAPPDLALLSRLLI